MEFEHGSLKDGQVSLLPLRGASAVSEKEKEKPVIKWRESREAREAPDPPVELSEPETPAPQPKTKKSDEHK